MQKLVFFDTTLRDGEQAPGNTMNPRQKLEIALALENLGVDIIEAGFPASSEEDFEACTMIAENIKNSVVCGFARCKEEDIMAVFNSLRNAKKPAIHIFLPVSDLHLEKKMGIDRAAALALAEQTLKKVSDKFATVYFGLEDATRADEGFLIEMIGLISKYHVDCINLADTVGRSQPNEIEALVIRLKKEFPDQSFGLHCHNDLGLATANALAAVHAGIHQIQVTMNGIGERAGNTALEEVVAALIARPDYYNDVSFNILSKKIRNVSSLVYQTLGRTASFEKSVVGINSFRHEAGIHVDGLRKDAKTYEIFDPQEFGYEREIVQGRHSGKTNT